MSVVCAALWRLRRRSDTSNHNHNTSDNEASTRVTSSSCRDPEPTRVSELSRKWTSTRWLLWINVFSFRENHRISTKKMFGRVVKHLLTLLSRSNLCCQPHVRVNTSTSHRCDVAVMKVMSKSDRVKIVYKSLCSRQLWLITTTVEYQVKAQVISINLGPSTSKS